MLSIILYKVTQKIENKFLRHPVIVRKLVFLGLITYKLVILVTKNLVTPIVSETR